MQLDFANHYKDRYVRVNGLRLHYTDWGGKSDRYVVLVHGFNVQCHTWDPLADALRRTFRVLCPDLRGHGDSDWAKDGYRVDRFVSDLYEFARKLDLPPFDFVGHSLGSRIGIAYGGEHSETLKHLVLSDTGPETPRDAALEIRGRAEKNLNVRGFRNYEHALAAIRELQPSWQPIFHQLHAQHQYRLNWADKLIPKADPDMIWIMSSIGVKEVPYLWEMAAHIRVPTLIMRGEESTLLTEELLERMLQTIPNSTAARFKTGHYIPRQAPREFFNALDAFLLADDLAGAGAAGSIPTVAGAPA
jgi:pimeloyl-ACP methyl ester carboxylesterase